MNRRMKKYERTWVNFANIWAALTVFIMSFAFALEGPFPFWGYFWIVITLLLLIPLLSAYHVASLSVDKAGNILIVEFRKWWLVKKIEEYPLNDIKAELSNEVSKMGRKEDVFRIFAGNQKIGEMVTWFSGWHKETVRAFIQTIKEP